MFHPDFEPLPKRPKLIRSRNVLDLSNDLECNDDIPYSPAPIKLFKKRNLCEITSKSPEIIKTNESIQLIKKSKRIHSMNNLHYDFADNITNNMSVNIDDNTSDILLYDEKEENERAENERAEDAVYAGYALNGFMMSLFNQTVESIPKLTEHIEAFPDYVNNLATKLFNVKITNDTSY